MAALFKFQHPISFFIVCILLTSGSSPLARAGTGKSRKTDSQPKVETITQNTWSSGKVALINYDGAWDFDSLSEGQGIVIRLFERSYIIGTFDGICYDEIVFQLPSTAKIGETYTLKAVPYWRIARKKLRGHRLAEMRAAEVIAVSYAESQFGVLEKGRSGICENRFFEPQGSGYSPQAKSQTRPRPRFQYRRRLPA